MRLRPFHRPRHRHVHEVRQQHAARHGNGSLLGPGLERAAYFVNKRATNSLAAAQAAGNQAEIDRLNATPLLPPGEMQNYHASIGGPVYSAGVFDGRNRLFFFWLS